MQQTRKSIFLCLLFFIAPHNKKSVKWFKTINKKKEVKKKQQNSFPEQEHQFCVCVCVSGSYLTRQSLLYKNDRNVSYVLLK